MRDHGGLIVRVPAAVHVPSTIDELASCVRQLRADRTPWVTRGAGHSSGGQSLIHGGAVVEMSKLTAIVADDGPTVTVQAGIRWREVMTQLVRTGRRPTVVTGELTTTVGGTLSVGGVGDTSHFEGLQIDGVRALTIVTPDGEIHRVSADDELARFILAGHGQLGVIAEATLATRPRGSTIAARALALESLSDYLALVDSLIAQRDGGPYPFVRGRLLWRDGVPHTVVKATVGAFSADLAAAPPADLGGAVKASEPLIVDLLAPTDRERPAFAPCAELVLPRANALAIWSQLTDDVRSSGLAAHLPDGASVAVVARGTLPLSPVGDGAVVIALRPKLTDEVTARRVAAVLRGLCARALSLGARLYPIGEEPDDVRWARHQYADAWPAWSALKDRLDPIPEQSGGAFAPAFADQLVRAANAVEWRPTISADAKRALITELVRRWLGCAVTAFVADGGAPTTAFAWQTFLVKYPVCTRLFAESEHAWRRDCAQLSEAIAQTYPDAVLANVEHHAGFLGSRRSAHVLTFADGRRTVYRPYALPAAAWFIDVCAALNPVLELPLHVRALRVEGEHTWDEFVEAAPCAPADVRAYFVRAGMVARLFEAVRALDMHARNVRMLGAFPVILDLEGVLAWRGTPSPAAAGFLPVATRGPSGERVDLGGLHPGGSVTLPLRQPVVRNGAFVDEAPVKTIAPTVPAPIREHVDDILEGYRALDAALGRASLESLTARAATLRTSLFGRSVMAYRALLFASIAPPLLRSEELREQFLQVNAEPIELSSLRSLRAVRYVGAPPVPSLRPHSADALAMREAMVRATIAAEPPTS